jgi:hypothetical protein
MKPTQHFALSTQHSALSTEWTGCYDGGWNGEIVPEAFAHPAKVSRALIRRIYEHAFAESWLQPGSVVVDPFGGIAGTALDAMWNGCHWLGVELEPRFCLLARGGNCDGMVKMETRTVHVEAKPGAQGWFIRLRIEARYWGKHGETFGGPKGEGFDSEAEAAAFLDSEIMTRSDSDRYDRDQYKIHFHDDLPVPAHDIERSVVTRKATCGKDDFHGLHHVLGNLELWQRKYGTKPGFGSAQMVQGDSRKLSEYSGDGHAFGANHGYQNQGDSNGNLAVMPEGKFDAVVSSPPYAAIAAGAGGLNTKPGRDGQQSGRSPDSASQGADQHYGESAGQLSAMAEGAFDAVVSSPPYEKERFNERNGLKNWPLTRGRKGLPYGNEDGQIGSGRDDPDTFWQAAREIVAQCRAILRPGGHAIWITKDFVRKGKRVPFSDQWQALCESQGFKLVCRHRAMLVAYHGEQDDLLGDTKQLKTERKSFFRRLAEKKGSPAIDHEDVICLVRL